MSLEPQRTTASSQEPALSVLLKLYAARADLRSRFPEAVDWDFRRLVDWARGVAAGVEPDASREELRRYAQWFEDNSVTQWAPGAVPWNEWRASWKASAADYPAVFETMQDEVRTAFNQHLATLCLLVAEFELKTALEVGTQFGHSSVALLEAAGTIDGRVYSIDIEPCTEAKNRVRSAGLAGRWTFIQGDALQVRPPAFPAQVDLLFIDTFHLYSQTRRELDHFAPYVGERGWIVLHDAVTFPGVSKAVREFLEARKGQFVFYPHIHQHGLLLLRRVRQEPKRL
jgi:predicted O-methyltransferase YrrM